MMKNNVFLQDSIDQLPNKPTIGFKIVFQEKNIQIVDPRGFVKEIPKKYWVLLSDLSICDGYVLSTCVWVKYKKYQLICEVQSDFYKNVIDNTARSQIPKKTPSEPGGYLDEYNRKIYYYGKFWVLHTKDTVVSTEKTAITTYKSRLDLYRFENEDKIRATTKLQIVESCEVPKATMPKIGCVLFDENICITKKIFDKDADYSVIYISSNDIEWKTFFEITNNPSKRSLLKYNNQYHNKNEILSKRKNIIFFEIQSSIHYYTIRKMRSVFYDFFIEINGIKYNLAF